MSYDIAIENIPSFIKRIGDRVIEGSNNSILVLGSDRISNIDTGYGHIGNNSDGKKAGSIHLIVGRENEDFNIKNDKASLMLSMKTDVDKNYNINAEKQTNGKSTVAIKADTIRLVVRDDLKFVSENGKSFFVLKSDGTIVIDGQIKLGKNATERIILGDAFKRLWTLHQHPTAVGMSGPPVNHPLTDEFLSKRKVFVE